MVADNSGDVAAQTPPQKAVRQTFGGWLALLLVMCAFVVSAFASYGGQMIMSGREWGVFLLMVAPLAFVAMARVRFDRTISLALPVVAGWNILHFAQIKKSDDGGRPSVAKAVKAARLRFGKWGAGRLVSLGPWGNCYPLVVAFVASALFVVVDHFFLDGNHWGDVLKNFFAFLLFWGMVVLWLKKQGKISPRYIHAIWRGNVIIAAATNIVLLALIVWWAFFE